MDKNKRGKYVGVLGTIVAHAALLALLIFISFTIPQNDDEGGVPVMMGDVESAQEGADNSLVDVDILPEETEAAPAPSTPEAPKEEPIITQETEKTVEIKAPKVKAEKTTPKVKTEETQKKVEKSEAEIAAEKKRLAEAKAEAERKAAAEAAAKKVAGAFGKGSQMGNSSGTSDSGTGKEGSKDGNSTTGAKSGVGGYGTFNLGGRSLGEGGLPRPTYNVQEEGKVVVSIVVNPAGRVIDANINISQTNTVNTSLRKAALEAAKKARFNEVTGVNNQSGTITYYFKLK
jgi:TonB family protein